MAAGPLDGIRVVDLTSVVLGPYATQIMGDLGAEVIKVEPPSGDSTRFTGPHRSPDMAALFMGVNRNKRSIVLDLKEAKAKEALWRLIDEADVFVHNMRPQKLEKLGFSSKAVLARNSRIVHAGLYGYRQGGEYAQRPAYDDIIQGQCGIADLMAFADGVPKYTPLVMADKTCALSAVYSILAALLARERTGQGQVVEVPMFETMVSFTMIEHLYGRTFVGDNGHTGYSRVLDPWRRPYPTRDGYISMMAYTDIQWDRFWREVGRPELSQDSRFDHFSSRTRNIGELYELAGKYLRERSTREWERTLSKLEIPNTRINSINDLIDDPHLSEVGFFRYMSHPTEGPILMTDQPTRFNGDSADLQYLQPRLGEHSVEILAELGLSKEEISAMVRDGVSASFSERSEGGDSVV